MFIYQQEEERQRGTDSEWSQPKEETAGTRQGGLLLEPPAENVFPIREPAQALAMGRWRPLLVNLKNLSCVFHREHVCVFSIRLSRNS